MWTLRTIYGNIWGQNKYILITKMATIFYCIFNHRPHLFYFFNLFSSCWIKYSYSPPPHFSGIPYCRDWNQSINITRMLPGMGQVIQKLWNKLQSCDFLFSFYHQLTSHAMKWEFWIYDNSFIRMAKNKLGCIT